MKKMRWILLLLGLTLLTGCASVSPSDGCPVVTVSATGVVTPSPTPLPSDTPTVSETDPIRAQREAVSAFIAAQNAGDWDAFTALWASSEQPYWRDFFSDANNAAQHNAYCAIQSAQLADTYRIADFEKRLQSGAFDNLPYSVWGRFTDELTPGEYDMAGLWIVKADYALEKPFRDYREGTNYRVLLLLLEGDAWKVLQDGQGYPDAAAYFGDVVPAEPDNPTPEETPNVLVDGTVHGTQTATGYFLRMQYGDYAHALIRTTDGEDVSFWVTTGCAPGFDALSAYQKIQFTWENRDTYIDEAGEVINMDVIIGFSSIG